MDRLEMRIKPLLRGLVVIGGNNERGIGPGPLRVAGEFDRLGGRVRSGARDHWNPALGDLDRELHHPLMLGMAERRRFAGRAAGHDPMRAFADLPIDKRAKSLLIHGTVAERRDESGDRALEHRYPPHSRLASTLLSCGRGSNMWDISSPRKSHAVHP